MTIENNPKEIAAMEEFHKGNRAEGLRLQEEFASAFREEYMIHHCPCKRFAAIMETRMNVLLHYSLKFMEYVMK